MDPDEVLEQVRAKLWYLAPDDAVRASFGTGVDRCAHQLRSVLRPHNWRLVRVDGILMVKIPLEP